MFIRNHKKEAQQGQILLITVMLLAAAVTVVMTIAFNSTTETQITKLEEDSQKALSAAESALEAAIQQKGGVVAIDTLPAFVNSNITGQAEVIEMSGNIFVTPLLQRDEQYTFYMSSYNAAANTFTPFSEYGELSLYLKSEAASDCPALELTFIEMTTNNLRREIVDPCSPAVVTAGADGKSKMSTSPITESLKGITFSYKTSPGQLVGINNMKVLIVRVLNASTRVGFKTSASSFPSQGRVVTSEAKTQSGVTKRIELFQSNPQIPSDFFITSF